MRTCPSAPCVCTAETHAKREVRTQHWLHWQAVHVEHLFTSTGVQVEYQLPECKCAYKVVGCEAHRHEAYMHELGGMPFRKFSIHECKRALAPPKAQVVSTQKSKGLVRKGEECARKSSTGYCGKHCQQCNISAYQPLFTLLTIQGASVGEERAGLVRKCETNVWKSSIDRSLLTWALLTDRS